MSDFPLQYRVFPTEQYTTYVAVSPCIPQQKIGTAEDSENRNYEKKVVRVELVSVAVGDGISSEEEADDCDRVEAGVSLAGHNAEVDWKLQVIVTAAEDGDGYKAQKEGQNHH